MCNLKVCDLKVPNRAYQSIRGCESQSRGGVEYCCCTGQNRFPVSVPQHYVNSHILLDICVKQKKGVYFLPNEIIKTIPRDETENVIAQSCEV